MRAALGSGPEAIEAYHAWRASVLLDDIDWPTFRLLPLLDATAKRHNIADVDAKRIEGAAKHIWLSNTLRLNSIVTAVRVLRAADIPVLLLKGAALFARDPTQIGVRATGDYDVLVRDVDKRRAVAILADAGFHPLAYHPGNFSDRDFETLHAAAFTWGERSQRGQIDLHWRASGELPAPGLSELLFSAGETAELGGEPVTIPSLPDHIVLGLIHTMVDRGAERADWFVEIAQIIKQASGQLDWERVAFLCNRYEMNGAAAATLESLNKSIPGLVDENWIRFFIRRTSMFERVESRAREGTSRSLARRLLVRAFDRIRAARVERSTLRAALSVVLTRETWSEVATSLVCAMPERFTRFQLRWLRNTAGRRPEYPPGKPGDPEFIFGWSLPELTGRWSEGPFQLLRLRSSLPAGSMVSVRLQVRAFIPNTKARIDVALFGGVRGQEVSLGAESNWPSTIVVPASVRHDGAVVVAIKIFNPVAPATLGLSDDQRLLGIFVERVAASE